ncbi:MAG: hypothetical protein WCD76_02800, partial [Pyrinomonadaceae bacterium]
LGVAGLYFYQQRQATDDSTQVETGTEKQTETRQAADISNAAPSDTATAAPSIEIPQPTATPEITVENIALPPQQTAPVASHDAASTTAPTVAAAHRAAEAGKRQEEEAKKSSATETRKTKEKDERPAVAVAPVKHGKKGEPDGEQAQIEQRPRRVGSIVYPEARREGRLRGGDRRQERRAVDRVRSIFEGQPPR